MSQRDNLSLSKLQVGYAVTGNLIYFDLAEGQKYGPQSKLVLSGAEVFEVSSGDVSDAYEEVNVYTTASVGEKLLAAGLIEQKQGRDGPYFKANGEPAVTIEKVQGDTGPRYSVFFNDEELTERKSLSPEASSTSSTRPAGTRGQSARSAGSSPAAPKRSLREIVQDIKTAFIVADKLAQQLATQGVSMRPEDRSTLFIQLVRSGSGFADLLKVKEPEAPVNQEAPAPPVEVAPKKRTTSSRAAASARATKEAAKIRDAVDAAAAELAKKPAAVQEQEEEDDELPF